MELQLLLVLLGSAAASLLVAAVLGILLPSIAGPSRWGSLAGVLAMLVAVLIGSRIGTEQWPVWPPGQARAWWVYVVGASAVGWLIAAAVVGLRGRGLAAAFAGAVGGVLIAVGPLAGVIGRMDVSNERWGWRIGVAVGLAALAFAAQRATHGAGDEKIAGVRPGPIARLRDEHAATVGLGLVFGLGALGVLFTASSMTLCLLVLAIAAAWGGLAITGWLIKPGLNLSGAAVVASLGYAAVWVIAYFFGEKSHLWVLAVAVAAPMVVAMAAALGPWSRRGGWVRWGVTVVASLAIAAVVPAAFGPAYIKTIPDAGEATYP